ncbi:MAG TPA: serine protease [Ohtaekwangia sp.]|nr:serine protease [Ohtaekwangia sp.]
MESLENLDPLLRTFWFIALPASIVFVIQTVMTFLGSDAHDGLDADFDSDFHGAEAPFQLFTFRNLINFLLGFGWTGISFYNLISNPIVLVALSFLVGVVFIVLFFLVIRQIERLAEDNTFKISNTLNKTGSVYLTIPAHKTGTGKVQISVQGSFHELDAITENEKIETSAMVRVVKIAANNLIVVEKL